MYLKKLWLKPPKAKEGSRYPGTGSKEGPKQTHTKTHHLKWPKLKEDSKGRKMERKRQLQGGPIRLSANFSTENSAGQKGVARYIHSSEREKPAT